MMTKRLLMPFRPYGLFSCRVGFESEILDEHNAFIKPVSAGMDSLLTPPMTLADTKRPGERLLRHSVRSA